MDSTLVIVGGLLILLLVVAVVAARAQGPRSTSLSGMAARERAMATQADVEEHDIEEMIEARNALRRRIGRPPIGDELAEDARRDESDD